jgi:hypothetical protein
MNRKSNGDEKRFRFGIAKILRIIPILLEERRQTKSFNNLNSNDSVEHRVYTQMSLQQEHYEMNYASVSLPSLESKSASIVPLTAALAVGRVEGSVCQHDAIISASSRGVLGGHGSRAPLATYASACGSVWGTSATTSALVHWL